MTRTEKSNFVCHLMELFHGSKKNKYHQWKCSLAGHYLCQNAVVNILGISNSLHKGFYNRDIPGISEGNTSYWERDIPGKYRGYPWDIQGIFCKKYPKASIPPLGFPSYFPGISLFQELVFPWDFPIVFEENCHDF